MAYGIGNPSPDLGQEQKCGLVKPVNGISTLSILIIDSHNIRQYRFEQTIKKKTCTDSLPLKNEKNIYICIVLYIMLQWSSL